MQSVMIITWTGTNYMIVVETYFNGSESVIASQRDFHILFMLHWNNAFPDRKSIISWIENLNITSVLIKRMLPGRPWSF